jgi:hypothetical protein
LKDPSLYKTRMSDLKTFLLKNKDINGEYNVVLKTYD